MKTIKLIVFVHVGLKVLLFRPVVMEELGSKATSIFVFGDVQFLNPEGPSTNIQGLWSGYDF